MLTWRCHANPETVLSPDQPRTDARDWGPCRESKEVVSASAPLGSSEICTEDRRKGASLRDRNIGATHLTKAGHLFTMEASPFPMLRIVDTPFLSQLPGT